MAVIDKVIALLVVELKLVYRSRGILGCLSILPIAGGLTFGRTDFVSYGLVSVLLLSSLLLASVGIRVRRLVFRFADGLSDELWACGSGALAALMILGAQSLIYCSIAVFYGQSVSVIGLLFGLLAGVAARAGVACPASLQVAVNRIRGKKREEEMR